VSYPWCEKVRHGLGDKTALAVVFLTILTLGLCLGLPAEGVLETVYESEDLPCEGIPLCSIVVPPAAARTTRAALSSLHPNPGTPFPFFAARVRDTDANRSADARISLALLCTLLC
jgi:hypothetical protein